MTDSLCILGAGLAGCSAALDLAQRGHAVTLIDRANRPMMAASRHNEGKLHLGYIYAADPDRRTHRIMAEGSLRFLGEIERLTGMPRTMQSVSAGFNYIVPEDSLIPAQALWSHVQAVDDTVAALGGQLPRSTWLSPEALSRHYGRTVTGGFRTPEIAIDPGRLSDIVGAAVLAHPNIDFLSATIREARQEAHGGYSLTLRWQNETVQLTAPRVINALWTDRLRLDAMVGLHSPHTWSRRWKATVMIDVPAKAVTLPPTTAMVGAYGDFVLYGAQRVYVSWYPTCRLSMQTLGGETVHTPADEETIRRDSLDTLARLIPGVRDLHFYAETTKIGGGVIMAVGDTDIDQRQSGLHARHQIGVEGSDNWLSVSTGKLCTAPMFGVQAAQRILAKAAA
ncbi:NAD(P)/FAD-dependent oxidoreductase [Tropicibacter sp. S64]|uniref:NAD(P)/FAD-dependent oxidoreductase n=1 Tax=Tropicibacter sp. S64 TaxID=3415122 RepID=UPI003C7D3C20